MTAAKERTLKTLALGWIFGGLTGALALLVPAALSVNYLTPIVVAGPFVGLIAGALLTRRTVSQPISQRRTSSVC